MAFNKRLINTGGAAACNTDSTDPFGDSSGVALYSLDYDASDASGSHDGSPTNVEFGVGGKINYGARFNGSNSGIFISSTGTSVTDYDQDFSISCWFRFDSGSTGGNLNFLFMGGGTENVQMWVTLANGVRFQLYNSGATYKVDTGAINAGVFYHVVATRSKTDGLKIYLDSVEKDTDSYTGNANPGLSGKDSIGQYFNGTRNNFEGVIDQVRIYSTALDSNQVTDLYNEKPEVDTSNFKAVLYEGNDATKHFVSNVGLDLDVDNGGDGGLVWVKNRDGAFNHILVDSIRGANNLLFSDTTAAALTSNTTLLSSLEKTGFFVGYDGTDVTNGASNSYVAWVFKGGGDDVLNEQGSIDSQVSANTAAGFSIVKYTGNNLQPQTVGHGLNYAPEVILQKGIDANFNWHVYHSSVMTGGDSKYLRLNSSSSMLTDGGADVWTSGFSSTTFGIGQANNASGQDFIAYCWHSVAGYSKIGSYEGNGNTATTTITTGFEPSWVMIKRTDSSNNWVIFDNKRDTTSPLSKILYADLANTEDEGGTTTSITISSTGFSMSTSQFGGPINTDGGQYIYMAFK